jgi:putative oxygen-independent coproporphyrinogen III oxidase
MKKPAAGRRQRAAGKVSTRPVSPGIAPRAAYIHVPFCVHRCGYCNFTLVAGRDDLIEAYLTAIERELAGLERPRPIDTLFFGGGTPTYLPPAALERLLGLVRRWFPLQPGYEFSVEANPADLDAQRVAVLAAAGVTRVSLGAQSFDPAKLALLERDHQAEQIAAAVALLRPHIRSLSLDLIFGTPGETLALWQRDLELALALEPDHLSTYGLTFERGTAFWARLQRGELRAQDEEHEGAMFTAAIDRLTAAGFEHYEVSNFARAGQRCRHNEVYWAGEEYYAAGPGAARYVDGRREVNYRSTTTYIQRVLAGRSPVAESETLSSEDRAREALVIGLRRLRGVERADFARRFGYEIDALVGTELHRFIAQGLLHDTGTALWLTRAGLLVSDALWPAFLRA